MLIRMLRRFQRDQDGAVTVDWVVLTAGIVGLGLIVATTIGSSTTEAAVGVSSSVGSSVSDAIASNMSTEEFLASYKPLSSSHKGGSGSDSWVRRSYARNSAMSDSALQSSYARSYASATSGSARAADRVAVQERILNERGIGIPSGNKTASQIASSFG